MAAPVAAAAPFEAVQKPTASAKDIEASIDGKATAMPTESSGMPETSKLDDPEVMNLSQKKHKKQKHHHKK